MATRYSGGLTIRVLYRDQGDYKCNVSGPDGRWSGYVRPAAAGSGSGIAYDSPRAYDEIAATALVFADDDKHGIAESAEYTGSGYKIRRIKGYWEKYPGGSSRRPARMRSRSRQHGPLPSAAVRLTRYRKQNPRSRAIRQFRFRLNNPKGPRQMECIYCGAGGPTWAGKYPKTKRAHEWEHAHSCRQSTGLDQSRSRRRR